MCLVRASCTLRITGVFSVRFCKKKKDQNVPIFRHQNQNINKHSLAETSASRLCSLHTPDSLQDTRSVFPFPATFIVLTFYLFFPSHPKLMISSWMHDFDQLSTRSASGLCGPHCVDVWQREGWGRRAQTNQQGLKGSQHITDITHRYKTWISLGAGQPCSSLIWNRVG